MAGFPSHVLEPRWQRMEEAYSRSPIHVALGLRLQVMREGQVEIHYDGSVSASNRRGVTAGGAIAAILDSAIVQSCMTLMPEDDQASTIDLKINFVRPGPPATPLVASANIEYLGGTTAVGIGHLYMPDGQLVAVGIATLAIRRKPST